MRATRSRRSDLAVVDSEFGRLGSLCCAAYLLGPEVNTAAPRQYAVEGQVFVLAPRGMVGQAGLDRFADTDVKRWLLKLGGGHARIYGPDGRSLATPLAPMEEGVLYAEIDYGQILAAKNAYDPTGHYSRPDVLRLQFNSAVAPRVVGLEAASAPSFTDTLEADRLNA